MGAALCLALAGCGEGVDPEGGDRPDAAVSGFCEPPQRLCGGDCVSLANDPAHCGQCGVACPESSFCDDGACATICSAGTTECGGACADLETDPNHCGACDRACPGDRVCERGGCRCPEGLTECNGACVDVQTNRRHCGQCSFACENDELCQTGACVCESGARETLCDDGRDDDCDGLVDCDDPDCEGVTRRCNGACGAGQQACSSGAWGACEGGDGTEEICGDGVDQDCDGEDSRNPDGWEPNDDCTQCRLVQPGADPNVVLEARFDSVDDRVDCYRFVADDGAFYRERIRLTLAGIPSGHDYDLYLYEDQAACQAGTPLARSAESGDEDEAIDWGESFGFSDSGTYFVRVVRYEGYACERGYSLTIDGLR